MSNQILSNAVQIIAQYVVGYGTEIGSTGTIAVAMPAVTVFNADGSVQQFKQWRMLA